MNANGAAGKAGWRFWLLWVVIHGVAFSGGSYFGFKITDEITVILFIILLTGIFVSIGQWVFLFVTASIPFWWVFATLPGWIIAWIFTYLPFGLHGFFYPLNVFLALVGSLIAGILSGQIQANILKTKGYLSTNWMKLIIRSLFITMSLSVLFLFYNSLLPFENYETQNLFSWGLSGMVFGALTGKPLYEILRHPNPPKKPPSERKGQ
jgi:hypothetical protein